MSDPAVRQSPFARLADAVGPTWLIAWGFVLLATTLIAAVFAAQWHSSMGPHGETRLPAMIGHALAEWWSWAALAPFVFLGSARLPLGRKPEKLRNLPVHLLAGFLFTGAHVGAVTLIEPLLHFPQPPPNPMPTFFGHLLLQRLAADLIVYWGLVGLAHGLMLQMRLVARDRAAAQLRAELTQAQLDALRIQLNPHFLFNALNTVSGLVHREPEVAERAIADLGDILRAALRSTDQLVPLAEELSLTQRYLDIEQLRLGDRLHVRFDVAPDSSALLVPVFALQLLAENSVRHAIEPAQGGGTLLIAAHSDGGALRLSVEDEVRKADGAGAEGHGIGLANLRARLEHLFGGRAAMTFERLESGTRATLTLPARSAR